MVKKEFKPFQENRKPHRKIPMRNESEWINLIRIGIVIVIQLRNNNVVETVDEVHPPDSSSIERIHLDPEYLPR